MKMHIFFSKKILDGYVDWNFLALVHRSSFNLNVNLHKNITMCWIDRSKADLLLKI